MNKHTKLKPILYYLDVKYNSIKNKLKYKGAAPKATKILNLKVSNIQYTIPDSAFSSTPPQFGIKGGGWDLKKVPFEERIKHKSMANRFEKNKPWEHTERYHEVKHRIESGDNINSIDNKDQSFETFKKYLKEIDSLYNKIDNEGYKTQEELMNTGFLPRDFYMTNEVTVDITRNGTFCATHGLHRLSIAKLLDIEYVPVRVRIRHTEWQKLRNRVYHSKRKNYDPSLENYVNHPDMDDVL